MIGERVVLRSVSIKVVCERMVGDGRFVVCIEKVGCEKLLV